jgi:hypothetical protein
MGNKSSSLSLVEEIDKIATKFIITQNSDDMQKLFNKEHCDKLVILTAKVIGQNLDESEQKQVLEHIKPKSEEAKPEEANANAKPEEANANAKPEEANANAKPEEANANAKSEEANANAKSEEANANAKPEEANANAKPEEANANAKPDMNDNINLNEPIQKGGDEEKSCIEIAKYYVKIAHLYGAIMKTINPVIVSKDKDGNNHKYDLSSKQSIPSDEEVKSIEHNNFCSRRLNSLIQESDYDRNDPNNILIDLKPRFCNMNYDNNTKKSRQFYKGDNTNNDKNINTLGKFGGKNMFDDDDSDDRRDGDRDRRDGDRDRDRRDGDRRDGDRRDGDRRDGDRRDGDGDRDRRDGDRDRDRRDGDRDRRDGDGSDGDKDSNDKEINKNVLNSNNSPAIEIKDDIKTDTDDNRYEIGIPELIKLYYDTEYDTNTGEFTKMSPSMLSAYQADVKIFYESFTGKNIPTDENGNKTINQFNQIPLREFHNSDKCKKDGVFTQNYEVSYKDKLFQEYANHIKIMTNNMDNNQNKLVVILQDLFKVHKVETKKEGKKEEPKPEGKIEAEKKEQPKPEGAIEEPKPEGKIEQPKPVEGVEEPKPVEGAIEEPKPAEDVVKIEGEQPKDIQVGGDFEAGLNEEIILNPDLDEEKLTSLINSARQLIVQLYVTCEEDFLKGISLFEGIVAVQLAKTTNSQILDLNNTILDYLAE